MNKRSLRVLEFNKVKEILKKYAYSSSAKKLVDELVPYDNTYEINNSLEESNEALEILMKKGNPPIEGLCDIGDILQRAKKGGTLTPEQLLKVLGMLTATRRMQEFFKREEQEVSFPKLEDLAYILAPINDLEKEIERSILSEDEVSDNASTTLYNIRRSLKEKNSSVREKINSIVRSNSKYLQDSLYTIRGDRYVIPVKAEYKSSVPGLVHDQSSTGATLFIEPMGLVNLNNEIKELMLKEKAEIDRVLSALSLKVKMNAEHCESNFKILTNLDFIFSKGKYACELNAIKPMVRDDGIFNIMSGRHPLIEKDKVVPLDVVLGDEFDTLMITGPNTGGKTVTLKTVGLLHIMALSGLLIPASSNSSVSFFKEVFADIGDEQSIEQSLSTFSSHLTNIVNIMEYDNRQSLILFDELGGGTDPAEGAALAIAIIENLSSKGAKLIATTHYSELKAYALNKDRVENASVEFDINTLRPTYRLLIGVPGKSNAFEISKRIGLGKEVIDCAKNYMSKENLEFEGLIRNLQEKSIIAKKDARDAKVIKDEADNLKKKYEQKLERLEKVKDKAYMDAREEAKKIVANAKDEADEILKAMRELEKLGIGSGGRQRLEEERKKLKDSLEEKEKNLYKMKENDGEVLEKVALGMEAFLPSLNQTVVVISMPDNRGEVQVEAGIMKISVKLKDLRKTKQSKVEKVKKKRELKLHFSKVENRIDLRGLDAEEACYRVDKYLDDAYMGNLGEVTIVHGKGTGILRKAINDMLKRHVHVKNYRLGGYGEGGDGATIVELK
ncbi:endonuclease MutS2 [Clostridium botulinum]|uniref:endonuclease MutS2 n=1 Tax=Clostridium TaxID=1485 RepID=UPI000CF6DA2F|nr:MULTISPECIES: endonuclease MutS2 [Clostridium]MBN1055882.1 endonuclease MutS2 [Clostridium botulinum]NFT08606.1 endonuclease MutS2 [Clostridium botulinum]